MKCCRSSPASRPKFPLAERFYFLSAVRYVSRVIEAGWFHSSFDALPRNSGLRPHIWADYEPTTNSARKKYCREKKIVYRVFKADALKGFPNRRRCRRHLDKKKSSLPAATTGFTPAMCAFLRKFPAYGDLYVIVGHDANIRLLKGEGHPLLPEAERRYVVG